LAIQHRCWRFSIDDGRRVFDEFASAEDLLNEGVVQRLNRLRVDQRLLTHLVWARLDPADDERWDDALAPGPDDFERERSLAARVMVLLMDVCREVSGIEAPRGYLVDYLAAGGWHEDEVALALWGRRLPSFFRAHVPRLASAVERSGSWLQGGWMDGSTAARVKTELAERREASTQAIPVVGLEQSRRSGLDVDWHERAARDGLDQLEFLLSQASTDEALWIIDD
jgi:hypothetical protein